MRPGYLYFSTFAFFAFTGGRFTAPFLKEVAGFDDSLIGITIAIQLFFQYVLGSVGAIYSDNLEFKYPSKGRVYFLAVNVAGATLSFGIHGLVQYIFDGDSFDHPLAQILHFVARILYSAFWAVIFPVCDGITLSYLKSHGDDDEAVSNFGKERLLGAISWAIASIIIGPIVDRFGFGALSWATPILSLLCFVTFHKYVSDAIAWAKLNPPCNNENDNVSESITDEDTDGEMKETREDVQSIALLKSMLGSYTAFGYVICGFALYMGTGVVENLIFLFFEALGGTNTICGLTVGTLATSNLYIENIPDIVLTICILQTSQPSRFYSRFQFFTGLQTFYNITAQRIYKRLHVSPT